jgi:NAD+ diphosphatase
MEPGETIEEAVRREVKEEAGIRIGRVVYHSSQTWPFPSSLMIGCHAEALSTIVERDAAELEDCRWFERDEVRLMLKGAHPEALKAPFPMAIAHRLIATFAEAGN